MLVPCAFAPDSAATTPPTTYSSRVGQPHPYQEERQGRADGVMGVVGYCLALTLLLHGAGAWVGLATARCTPVFLVYVYSTFSGNAFVRPVPTAWLVSLANAILRACCAYSWEWLSANAMLIMRCGLVLASLRYFQRFPRLLFGTMTPSNRSKHRMIKQGTHLLWWVLPYLVEWETTNERYAPELLDYSYSALAGNGLSRPVPASWLVSIVNAMLRLCCVSIWVWLRANKLFVARCGLWLSLLCAFCRLTRALVDTITLSNRRKDGLMKRYAYCIWQMLPYLVGWETTEERCAPVVVFWFSAVMFCVVESIPVPLKPHRVPKDRRYVTKHKGERAKRIIRRRLGLEPIVKLWKRATPQGKRRWQKEKCVQPPGTGGRCECGGHGMDFVVYESRHIRMLFVYVV